jgi:hypothetical protein
VQTVKVRYYVETYDSNLEKFTAQRGVRKGPYSLFGLRTALRKLRSMGYPCDRDDPSVLVTRKPEKVFVDTYPYWMAKADEDYDRAQNG